MLSPLENILELTKERLNLHVNCKGFLHFQSLLRSQETPEKKSKRPNLPRVLATQRFCETRNFLGWHGLAANRILILSLDMGVGMYFSVAL